MTDLRPNFCFSCGKRLKWKEWDSQLQKHIVENPELCVNEILDRFARKILDTLAYRKLCCRRMFLSDPIETNEDMDVYLKYG